MGGVLRSHPGGAGDELAGSGAEARHDAEAHHRPDAEAHHAAQAHPDAHAAQADRFAEADAQADSDPDAHADVPDPHADSHSVGDADSHGATGHVEFQPERVTVAELGRGRGLSLTNARSPDQRAFPRRLSLAR